MSLIIHSSNGIFSSINTVSSRPLAGSATQYMDQSSTWAGACQLSPLSPEIRKPSVLQQILSTIGQSPYRHTPALLPSNAHQSHLSHLFTRCGLVAGTDITCPISNLTILQRLPCRNPRSQRKQQPHPIPKTRRNGTRRPPQAHNHTHMHSRKPDEENVPMPTSDSNPQHLPNPPTLPHNCKTPRNKRKPENTKHSPDCDTHPAPPNRIRDKHDDADGGTDQQRG